VGLCIQASSPVLKDGKDLPAFLAKNAKAFILDVDSTIYPEQIGLHPKIKEYITADANEKPDLAALRREWTEKGLIKKGVVLARGLTQIFPYIVHHYREKGPEALTHYFDTVYNVDYSVLSPQPLLVSAIEALRDQGCRVTLFTNGPWRGVDGRTLHAQKVLLGLGFSENAFEEKDVVDIMKTDRNPELLQHFGFPRSRAGDVFRKPDADAFKRVLETLKINPSRSGVVFFDDNADAVNAAEPFGVIRVHLLTHQAQIDDPIAQGKRDFAVWNDGFESEPYPLGLLLQKTSHLIQK